MMPGLSRLKIYRLRVITWRSLNVSAGKLLCGFIIDVVLKCYQVSLIAMKTSNMKADSSRCVSLTQTDVVQGRRSRLYETVYVNQSSSWILLVNCTAVNGNAINS